MVIIDVALPVPLAQAYSYKSENVLPLGTPVIVPFGSRKLVGIVWGIQENPSTERPLKEIESVLDVPIMPTETRAFLEWVSRYTLNPLGAILKMGLYSPSLINVPKERKSKPVDDIPQLPHPILTDAQRGAAESLIKAVQDRAFTPFALDGVTGSGKTEVYFEAIEAALHQGQQVLIMVPEIALTEPLESRFQGRFGFKPHLWHADITPAARRKNWLAVLEGTVKVVIGARSSLFLPFSDLGLIVVDEEHDGSYKQEEGAIYNGRDMAIVRAKIHKIPIILASATPSIETLVNIRNDRYTRLHLPNRYGAAELPTIQLVDMRHNPQEGPRPKGWLSPPLKEALIKTFEKEEQSLVFLNRRGYAPLTLCNTCGERVECPNCVAWLVEHKSKNALVCHHCGFNMAIPKACPKCLAPDSMIACGPGVERIEEEIKHLVPKARIALMTSDTMTSSKALREMLDRIHSREVDIIIGTQIMAKGHHFPQLTLVGIVDGDLGLGGADLRAPERTYQLLHQVAGRAGRDQWRGEVFVQTFQPENAVMQALQSQDQKTFMDLEIEEREDHGMPPFGKLVALIAAGPDSSEVHGYLQSLVRRAPQHPDVQILGPVPALMSKVRGLYRWRVLIKAPKKIETYGSVQAYMQAWLIANPKPPRTIRLHIDIDPYSFM